MDEEQYPHASCLTGVEQLEKPELLTLLYEVHEEKHAWVDEAHNMRDYLANIASIFNELSEECDSVKWHQSVTALKVMAVKTALISDAVLSFIGITQEELKEAETFAEIVNNLDSDDETP